MNPDGTEKWSYDTKSSIASSPAIGSDGTVYVGAWDKKVYAFGGPSTEEKLNDLESEANETLEESTPTEPAAEQPAKDLSVIYVMGAVAIMIVAGIIILYLKKFHKIQNYEK